MSQQNVRQPGAYRFRNARAQQQPLSQQRRFRMRMRAARHMGSGRPLSSLSKRSDKTRLRRRLHANLKVTLYLHFYVTEEVPKHCHILIFTRPHTLPSNKSLSARCDFVPEPNAPLTRLLSTN